MLVCAGACAGVRGVRLRVRVCVHARAFFTCTDIMSVGNKKPMLKSIILCYEKETCV